MKKPSMIIASFVLLLVCFIAVFELGKRSGFRTGSEWALVQANIVAREAGVFMPVSLKEDEFRIVIRQPRGIYKRAWQLADEFEDRASLKTANLLERVKQAGQAGNEARL